MSDFENYVYDFYGPHQLYGDFFGHTLTREEIRTAIEFRMSNMEFPFDGDSVDREIVRDILFTMRGERKTEHDVRSYFDVGTHCDGKPLNELCVNCRDEYESFKSKQ